MLDVAIVGAGLTGLALALRLQEQGLSVVVCEARGRSGGRILSMPPDDGQGAVIDLGASWYWPETEPRITALIESLGLRSFAQPDEGQVLHLADPNEGPQAMDVDGIHGGARRLSGGMGRLVEALSARLQEGTLRMHRRVVSLHDHGTHIDLQLVHGTSGPDQIERLTARRVVLAMPPRLIAQQLRFEPALPQDSMHALEAVPTWMAREAKAALRLAQPFWLAEGRSGSGFVSHAQAVLREIWDASDEGGAALAGFCAMPPEVRAQFSKSLPLLSVSQFAQLFGMQAAGEPDQVLLQDWSTDPLTCSLRDLTDHASTPPVADPLLRRPHWQGRLFFGGTETARQAAGHMEGALESVARLVDFLRPLPRLTPNDAVLAQQDALTCFEGWLSAERCQAGPRYQQQLKQLMSRQDRDRITQRALVATVEQLYSLSLERMAALDWPGAPAQASALTPRVLARFAGFSKSLVEQALAFNATSCALSNFPDEHRPDGPYLRAITADLAAAWREFALATHDLLQSRMQPA